MAGCLACGSARCYTPLAMTIQQTLSTICSVPSAPALRDAVEQAWAVRKSHHPDTILLVRPYATAPISVTGPACALDCAHCGGHYLQHMESLTAPSSRSSRSYLISGGCDSRGVVPLAAHREAIAELARHHRLVLHVGLMPPLELASMDLPVAAVSLDIVGDRETALEVYGLDVPLATYIAQFEALSEIAPVVPHITIGLHAGQIRGEYEVIRALLPLAPERVVFLVLIPTAGTRYASCLPPSPEQVASVLATARCLLPDTRLYLGCMRPPGRYRQTLDVLAIAAGVNAIVNPTRAAERAVEEAGLSTTLGDECCALY